MTDILEKYPLAGIATDKQRIEITINHPRTKPFVRATPDEQKLMYLKIYMPYFEKVRAYTIESVYRFEACKDGYVHMHCALDLSYPKVYVEGLVMDAATSIIHEMPKRTWMQLVNNHYSSFYTVFKSPAVLVQYTHKEDLKRVADWNAYIDKDLISKPII